MEESKHQRRTRIIEENLTIKPAATDEEKEHWPVGPLPDVPLNEQQADKPSEGKDEKNNRGAGKKNDSGFDEWSVSWP